MKPSESEYKEFAACWKWLVSICLATMIIGELCSCSSHRSSSRSAETICMASVTAAKDTASIQKQEVKDWLLSADSLTVVIKADSIATKQGVMYYPQMHISLAKPNKAVSETALYIDNHSSSVTQDCGSWSVANEEKRESATHNGCASWLRFVAWAALSILILWIIFRIFCKLVNLR